jgi:hypothetical protein
LTREEKACVQKQGANPKDYMFAYDVNDSYFKAVNKETGVERLFDRYRKAKNRYDY